MINHLYLFKNQTYLLDHFYHHLQHHFLNQDNHKNHLDLEILYRHHHLVPDILLKNLQNLFLNLDHHKGPIFRNQAFLLALVILIIDHLHLDILPDYLHLVIHLDNLDQGIPLVLHHLHLDILLDLFLDQQLHFKTHLDSHHFLFHQNLSSRVTLPDQVCLALPNPHQINHQMMDSLCPLKHFHLSQVHLYHFQACKDPWNRANILANMKMKEIILQFPENQESITQFIQKLLTHLLIVFSNRFLGITRMLRQDAKSFIFVPIIKLMIFFVLMVQFFTKST